VTAKGRLRKDVLTTRYLDKHKARLHSTENIIFFLVCELSLWSRWKQFSYKGSYRMEQPSFSYAAVAPAI